MAELRRVGGKMEPHRRITGRRILLPAEAELCNTLGLTESEYFYFVDLTESQIGKRSKGYELIPDIRNDPATIFTTEFFINLVLGIAISYVASLLAPKPRQPKTPPSLVTPGQTGNRRFAPQTGFNSVQELAALGEIIPLVFTRRENGHGGIRINTKLVWSQMRSLWSGQQLRGLFLLSSGELETAPDFAGYAIGDTTLSNYINAKLALYRKLGGGRITNTDRYDEGTLRDDQDTTDVFSVYWDRATDYVSNVISGTRTPGSQTQFGAFSPMANAMRFMVPYELVLKAESLSDENKADVDKKRNKIQTAFPRYAAVTAATGNDVGSTVTYEISPLNPAEQENFDREFDPWGMEDVKSSIDADRINGDDNLAIGDSYLIGSALAVCRNVTYSNANRVWIPDSDTTATGTFEITDSGRFNVRASGITQAHHPYELTVIQRAAVGTISNNTKCQVTEIGIKSTVWRQITGFSNVNSHPGHITYGQPGTIKNYEEDNGNISLGQMSKYINRYSFFRLQGRIGGRHPIDSWEYIDGGIPFAVKGNTPQPQYNFIRINHSATYQYEFRFVPYPGNLVQQELRSNAVTQIRLFQKDSLSRVDNSNTIFDVYYSGSLFNLTGNRASNSEWYLGELPEIDPSETGVLSTSTDNNGRGIPVSRGWQLVEEREFRETNDGVIDGAYFHSPYQKRRGQNGGWTNLHMYFRGERIGQIDKHYRGSVNNRWDSENLWPRNISEILGNETWSIEVDGYQYRTGEINSGSTEFWENSRDQKFSVRKYQWDSVSDSHTVHENWPTTAITGDGSGFTLRVRVYNNNPYSVSWEIQSEGSGYRSGDRVKFSIPRHSSDPDIELVVLTDTGSLVTDDPWPTGRNLNPFDAIADFVKYDAEQSSHLNGPEHEIVYCNEMNRGSSISYPGLAYAGLRLNSSKEWTSFSQFSAYLMRGIKVDRLINTNTEATNLFPEIAYTLLTDPDLGAGDLIGVTAVDRDRMTIAARFCEANGFYWDGVITENQNLREFIFEMAGYCLLDFTILAGKFSLVPSVPYNAVDFTINRSAQPQIRALFTDGNIKDLKVSFLSPEERQVFQARATYRHETANGFPETKVVDLALSNTQSNSDYQGGSEDDPRETFDLSTFCTSSSHAEKFLKYALRVRQLIDHGITFKTTPQDAMFLAPGEYFRLFSESCHTSRFENGSISSDGTVQSIGIESLSDTAIYYWRTGMTEVAEARINVNNGRTTDATLWNSVFTVKRINRSDRVYKVESLSYGEEGLIEIAGSHVPLTDTGSLAILDWNASDFT